MLLIDIRYAMRLLLKRPGFTMLTISVLAVCIGLSLYMFSFMHSMAFKALPFEDGDEIVVFDTVVDGVVRGGNSLEARDFEDLRNQVTGLEEYVALLEADVNVSGRDSARHYIACHTEPGLFSFTRTEPMLGRAFTIAEDAPGMGHVVLLSYDVWQNDFGGDHYVLDETIRVNGIPTQVIGVMPPGFHFPRNSDLWMPLQQDIDRIQRGTDTFVMGVARLADGVGIEEADAQVKGVMKQLSDAYPKTNHKVSARITSFPWTQMGDDGMLIISSCWLAATLLLLLGGVNVGNLLLSRALERDRETATRVALGAPRARLLLQMMWESLIIVVAGGVVGLLAAGWALEATNPIVRSFSEDEPYYWWVFGIDGFALMIFAAMLVVAAFLGAALPAWRATRGEFNAVLREGTRGARGRGSDRLSRGLVIAEVLLSVTILIATGIMISGAYRASVLDYGAEVKGIYTARISIPEDRYPAAVDQSRFAQDLRETLMRTGATDAVAFMASLPGTYTFWPQYEVEGATYPEDRLRPAGQMSTALPGSMEVIGMRLLEGRFFDSRDSETGMSSVIISASMAELNWPGEPALGKRFRILGAEENTPWLTVVGIVDNTTHTQAMGSFAGRPSFFLPMARYSARDIYVAFRSRASNEEADRALRTAMFEVDQDVPAYYTDTYAKRVSYLTGGVSFIAQIFVLFGAVAVLLAGSGIYGVMSSTVTRRIHEIGVKRALGATDRRVYADFFKAAGRQLLLGALPGAVIGGALGLMLSVFADDNWLVLITITLSAPVMIMGIVLLATWLPVRRALEMEPGIALHHE